MINGKNWKEGKGKESSNKEGIEENVQYNARTWRVGKEWWVVDRKRMKMRTLDRIHSNIYLNDMQGKNMRERERDNRHQHERK